MLWVSGICTIVMNQSIAQLRLPAVLGSNMVLQQGTRAPIWGWTAPGRAVRVTFRGETKTAVANASGRWEVAFRSLKAGGTGSMTITDGQSTRTLENILVGDVWICSGQSNMEWQLADTQNAQREVAAARFDTIRLFQVANKAAVGWTGDVEGQWVVCTPETASRFSAVGYFFGRSLALSENHPVGLIDATWGGTPAEAWTPAASLKAHPLTRPIWGAYEEGLEKLKKLDPAMLALAVNPGERVRDPGNKGEPQGWAKPEADLREWKAGNLPAAFSALPDLNIYGIVWFRRTITLTEDQARGSAVLNLGPIDDLDITYVNGVKVGETTEATPNFWATPRSYPLPAGALKAGLNTIAVRVHEMGGGGGFTGSPESLSLSIGGSSLPLAGEWRYRIEYSVPAPPPGLIHPNSPWSPASLYDAMIKPLAPFGLKGAIWYQGESNVGRAEQYSVLLPNMVRGWRAAWGQGNFAFLFTQLANFQARHPQPTESAWAELRESQDAVLKLPNTGSAVIIDIGEADDIHPRNKKDVGERLAMSARTFAFRGSEPAGNSPRLASWMRRGREVVVKLTDSQGLRTTDGRAPVGFAVRASGGAWVWAQAKIEGQAIVLTHPQGGEIADFRYAWADNPEVNLVNGLGLPVSPFRSDRPAWMK